MAQPSTLITDLSSENSPIHKRPLHILDDGSLVAVIVQQNSPISPYGSKNNANVVQVWYSPASRSSWSLKATYTIPSTYAVPASSPFHCGSVLLNDGSVYFAWIDHQQAGIYACVFSKTGTSTWANPTARETVFVPSAHFPYRMDLDVNRANNRVYIGWYYRGTNSTTDTVGTDVITRLGANSYDFCLGFHDIGGNAQSKTASEDFTLAVDPASTSSYTRIVYALPVVTTAKDYGDKIYWGVVRNSDNVSIDAGLMKTINIGRAGSRRNSWLWAHLPGQFTLIGVGGSGSGGEGWAYRFKATSPVSSSAQLWMQTVPLSYSARKFYVNRSNSLYSDVTATYANDRFSVYWHDSQHAYNLPGSFSGSLVNFENVQYAWDEKRVYDPATGRGAGVASGLYGGARSADAANKHDTLIAYFYRTSISSKDAGWMHQYNRPSRSPASVLPASNSVQSTALPTLGVYADLDQSFARSPIRPRWQIAKDAAFTQNLIEHTKEVGVTVEGTNVSNSYVYIADKLPSSMALTSGSWYVRAAHVDSFGTLGSWTAAQPFTVSHPPFASPISPARGAAIEYGSSAQVTFSWTAGDGYSGDRQTAYRVVVEINDDVGTPVLDTGKIASESHFATIEMPVEAKNQELRWRVQLWDADDTVGNLSAYALFMVADPPTVEITYPVAGSVVDNGRPNLSWTFTDPTGNAQESYRVVFLRDGAAVLDSGWRTGADTVYQSDRVLFSNEVGYTAILYVRNALGLESSTSSSFTTQWTVPASPDLSSLFIDTRYYDQYGHGYVLINWNNQVADPDFLSWRLYRRVKLPQSASVADEGVDWEMIHEEFSVSPPLDAPAYVYRDYTAPSNYDVHYMLTQTVMRFGSVVESRKISLSDVGKVVHLYSGAYWLIDPDADGEPEDVIRLPGAKADSYTEEYETEEMFIVGRGRHVELGDRLGYTGTLSVPLRFLAGSNASDGPRRQKLDLERFKAKRKAVYLRTPFGDVFLVNTGNISFERVPGVGSSEFIDVSFPYSEVFR